MNYAYALRKGDLMHLLKGNDLGQPGPKPFLLNLYVHYAIPTFIDPEKSHLKTLWEKAKMLVNSIFSFSRNVFIPFPKQI